MNKHGGINFEKYLFDCKIICIFDVKLKFKSYV